MRAGGAPFAVDAVDYHTAGEPFRIVTGGVPALEGASILEKRRFALERLDHVRRLLVYEPRGHADMYGGFVTKPEDEGADLGVVFFHNAGYSTACGHGTIALVTWALETGVLPLEEPEARVVVDVPSGRLETVARVEAGTVRSVRFRNVPSFVEAEGLLAEGLRADVAFGGAFYASVASPLPVQARNLPELIQLGREVKAELEAQRAVRPSGGAGAPGDLRRHLLGAGGHGAAGAPAQRDRVRRRRGRPLALRQRHVGQARAPGARRRAAARRGARPREHRRHGVPRPGRR